MVGCVCVHPVNRLHWHRHRTPCGAAASTHTRPQCVPCPPPPRPCAQCVGLVASFFVPKHCVCGRACGAGRGEGGARLSSGLCLRLGAFAFPALESVATFPIESPTSQPQAKPSLYLAWLLHELLQEDHFDIGAHFHHHVLHDDATGNTYFVDGLELEAHAAAAMGGVASGLGPTRVRWVVQGSTKAPKHTQPFRCASYFAARGRLSALATDPPALPTPPTPPSLPVPSCKLCVHVLVMHGHVFRYTRTR